MNKAKISRILLPIVILVVAVLISGMLSKMKKPPEQKETNAAIPMVEVFSVEQQSVRHEISSQGSVSPLNQTRLTAQVSAQVTSISEQFIAGAFFAKGDVLVQLETSDFETEVKGAQARYLRAKAELEEELARAEVAEQEWQAVFDQATSLALRKPQVATAKANLKSAEADLEKAKRNLERTKIRAPYAGLVKSRDVDIGQFVTLGTMIGEVYSTEIAEIRLPVTQHQAGFVEISEQGLVTLTSQFGMKQQTWLAQLHRSEAVVDNKNRMVYLIARLSDPYNLTNKHAAPLQFGRFVQANIQGVSQDNLIALPRNTVRGRDQAVVIDSDNRVDIRQLEVVRSDAQWVYAKAGVSAGELIASTPLASAVQGMKVQLFSDKSNSSSLSQPSTTQGSGDQ